MTVGGYRLAAGRHWFHSYLLLHTRVPGAVVLERSFVFVRVVPSAGSGRYTGLRAAGLRAQAQGASASSTVAAPAGATAGAPAAAALAVTSAASGAPTAALFAPAAAPAQNKFSAARQKQMMFLRAGEAAGDGVVHSLQS